MEPPSLFSRCLDLGVAPPCAIGYGSGVSPLPIRLATKRSILQDPVPVPSSPSSMASRPFTVTPRLSAGPPGRISPPPVVWCLGPATPLQNSRTPLVYDRDWSASVLGSKLPFPPFSQFHCTTGLSDPIQWCYHIFGCNGFSPLLNHPKHHFFSPLFAVCLGPRRGGWCFWTHIMVHCVHAVR